MDSSFKSLTEKVGTTICFDVRILWIKTDKYVGIILWDLSPGASVPTQKDEAVMYRMDIDKSIC